MQRQKLVPFRAFDILEGSIPGNPIRDLPGLQGAIRYLIDNSCYDREAVFYRYGPAIINPRGQLVNPYHENVLDIRSILDNPPSLPFNVSDINVPFANFPDLEGDTRVITTFFPYIKTGSNYLASLSGKRRWGLKKELKQQASVHIETTEIDCHFTSLYATRILELNGENFPWVFNRLPQIQTTTLPVDNFKMFDGGVLCGIASVVETAPGVRFVAIFNTTRPCISAFVYRLNQHYQEGTKLHFGPGTSINPEETRVYAYKRRVSNATYSVPFFLIHDSREKHFSPQPPYYLYRERKWHRAPKTEIRGRKKNG